jgi:hypothetical protein
MKKIIGIAAWMLIVFSLVGFSQSEKLVAITAEKEVPIQNDDVAAARTVALTLAARDAVERGFGTYINVKELPEMREVIAKASAGLRYNILSEGKHGKNYWVKIQANVMIPAEYVPEEYQNREELGAPMKNYVQKFPQGEINWGEGYIIAYGKGVISGKSTTEEQAERAAEVEAKARLLEMIQNIPLDERMRIGEDQRITFAMEGFVQEAEIVTESKTAGAVNVTVRAPIRGIKGLAMTVYGYYTPEPPKPETREPEPLLPQTTIKEPEKFTGIVIDARGLQTNPAVFPKVSDTKRREIYTVKQVNRQDLEKRGMASFALVARDVNISQLFPFATVIPVNYSQTAPVKKGSLRQGDYPYIAHATATSGDLKADLIISEEDAAKLRAIDLKTNALKECRVVIVISGAKQPS